MRDGVDWIVDFLLKVKGNYSKVIIDGANGKDLLENAMKEVKLKDYIFPTTGEYIEANTLFEQNIFKGRLRHMRQPGVDDIVTNCEKRAIGSSGGFGYKSIKIGADISIMDSMILACWGAEKYKEPKKKQKISY
jgi:hypothetical protein